MKKLTKKQQEIIGTLSPRCEECRYYKKWRGEMMCHWMSPFISSKENQRLRQAGSTMNCGTEGRNFMPNIGYANCTGKPLPGDAENAKGTQDYIDALNTTPKGKS